MAKTKKRTPETVQAEIEDIQRQVTELEQERESIVTKLAENFGSDNAELEQRLPVISARCEAASRRVVMLQAEHADLSEQADLDEFEALYKAQFDHFSQIKANDDEIANHQAAINDLTAKNKALGENYQLGAGGKLQRVRSKLMGRDSAKYSEIENALYQKYKVEGYI